MRTTFVMDPPPTVEDWLERRRALAQDLYDEVWEGEYRVAPAPSDAHNDVCFQLVALLRPLALRASLLGRTPCNVGAPNDFRVPDIAFLRGHVAPIWQPTAAIAVEVVSPGDESRRKLDFYFRHRVEEVAIVDPGGRTVEWFARGDEAFWPAEGSTLLGLTSAELAARIDWPA